MRLSERIRTKGELIQDFELASEERFLDAQELLARGQGTGAAYLLGYVAEMVLKTAIGRFDGARPSDRVYPLLAPAKKLAEAALPSRKFKGYHDVLSWAFALREKRKRKGRPLREDLAQNLINRASRIDRAWAVELRYFGLEVEVRDAERLLGDVAWIKNNRILLWK